MDVSYRAKNVVHHLFPVNNLTGLFDILKSVVLIINKVPTILIVKCTK